MNAPERSPPRPAALVLAGALALALVGWAAQASAAGREGHRSPRPAAAPAAPAPASPQDAGPAPYQPDLLRLSQIIGALSYLRDLCGDGDGDVWRDKMKGLLQAAANSDLSREQMAGAYNKGFRDYELIYRSCTPNARIVISRYLSEGAKLTRDLETRYGSG